ncbi:MBL fold metallo-hydrolase [Rhodocyclus tenuis]|uniref:MBL fold metallo-hydrolase n=1 Tax=Rhodocyclus gracilis TaxID=2929842 RepID=A0ABX0WF28_9RHOO|nr:MBL fold metallo-hydrolase [Rhodocyclus gracilis]NJA87891.1 MBL fold metallo-hydrolase [Rhodocyclus gracilis]
MIRRSLLSSLAALCLLSPQANVANAATPLRVEVYNPGERSLFPVASEIVMGEREAILIDAQFQKNDAEALVSKIQASGRQLKTIYISQSDPDYYFGLDVIHAAFPEAKIVATAPTVAAIKASMQGKLAHWGPILKENAPSHLIVPEVLASEHLTLEGRYLDIKGLHGAAPARSYVWIPSLKTVVGGVVIASGIHVWMADTQSVASRQAWQKTLREIEALKPAAIVPGHFLGEAPAGNAALRFTARYLRDFDAAATRAADAPALIAAMQKAYPDLGEAASLELSAKVIKGEMTWPQ